MNTPASPKSLRPPSFIPSHPIASHSTPGVGHFYLINHISDDHYLGVLAPWIERGLVTLFSADPTVETVQVTKYECQTLCIL